MLLRRGLIRIAFVVIDDDISDHIYAPPNPPASYSNIKAPDPVNFA